jgi:putative transposon-encoded protein
MDPISINEILAVDRTSIGPSGRVYIDKDLAGRSVKVVVIDDE